MPLFLAMVLKVDAQTSDTIQSTKSRITIAIGASGQWMYVPHGYNDSRPVIQKQRNAIGWNVPIMVGFGLKNSRIQLMAGVEFGQTWASAEHIVPNQFGQGTQTEIEKLRDGMFGFLFGPKFTFGNTSIGLYGRSGNFSSRLRRYIGINDATPEIQLENFTRLGTLYYGAAFELTHQISEFSKGRLDAYMHNGFKLSLFGSGASTTSLTSSIGVIYTLHIR